MEDPSAAVLGAARSLLQATGHQDSALYARTAVVDSSVPVDAPGTEKLTWDFGTPPLPPTPPVFKPTNGHRVHEQPAGPACVFCQKPTRGVGDDAFEFTGVHNANVKHVACAPCIFSSMLSAHPNRRTIAHGVAYAYRK